LVVLLLVAVVLVFLYVDSIAKTAVEKGATYALGVKTTLNSADVGIVGGDFTMKGLTVTNPEGFEGETFLKLGEGYVDVSMGSLRQETVKVPILTLTTVNLNLEKKGGQANYKVIIDNLKRLESGEAKGDKGSGKQFVIEEVVISDVNVEADVFGVGGQLDRARIPIKEIRLTNVGADGADSSELTNVVMKAIMAAVLANGADLPADMVNDLGGAMGGLTSLGDMGIGGSYDVGGQVMNLAGGSLDEATKGLGKSVDDAVKGLGGLLGRKKE
ncbi:MAG: hypothetical protein ACYSU7_05410, partial [Planctomycetota bacterium]